MAFLTTGLTTSMKNCLFLESAEWIFKLKNRRFRHTKALKIPCWSEPHSTVNRVVAGSSPARGAKLDKPELYANKQRFRVYFLSSCRNVLTDYGRGCCTSAVYLLIGVFLIFPFLLFFLPFFKFFLTFFRVKECLYLREKQSRKRFDFVLWKICHTATLTLLDFISPSHP